MQGAVWAAWEGGARSPEPTGEKSAPGLLSRCAYVRGLYSLPGAAAAAADPRRASWRSALKTRWGIRGDHLSNITCLARVFFNGGES